MKTKRERIEGLTSAQRKSYKNIVKRYRTKPNEVFFLFMEKCLMLRFPFIVIGIETDGYTHS